MSSSFNAGLVQQALNALRNRREREIEDLRSVHVEIVLAANVSALSF